MTWIWSERERLEKLLKSVHKWIEFHTEEVNIDPEVVTRAFDKSKDHAYEIISTLDIADESTAGFFQSWVELGLIAGYLTGWKDADKVLGDDQASTGGAFDLPSSEFHITQHINEMAKKYALQVTKETFDRLLADPVSPLVKGLKTDVVTLLRVCHESSLFAGFLSGVEDAFEHRIKAQDPFDLKDVMS